MDSCIKMIVVLIWVAVVLTLAPVVYAWGDGAFYMERPKLGVTASYEIEEEKRTFTDIETKSSTHDMREALAIETEGWVYHENLLEYRLSFEPEWRQEDFDLRQPGPNPDQTRDRDTSVLAYDTGVTLLKEKPLSLDLFAGRSTRRIDLSYTQDTEIESESRGARLHFSSPVLPVTLGYINRQSDQTGFYASGEDRDEVQVKIKHNAKNSITELDILHDSARRSTRSTFGTTDASSKATNTDLTNTFFFTDDNTVRLDSRLYNTRSEYYGFDYDALTVSEDLFWTHSRRLQSQSSLKYQRRKVDETVSEEKAIGALLTHRLEDVLTSNLGAGLANSKYEGGSEDRYRADMGFVFRGPIPKGSIEIGAAFDYGVIRRDGEGISISGEERFVLATGEDAVLRAEHVSVASIVVTDATGTVAYTENIDYRIYEVGPDVVIRRALQGNIADGQEVTVRYNYRVDAGYDDGRFGQDYRFDLALWSCTYLTLSHRRLSQEIFSGEPPADPIDDTFSSARLRFDAGWSETRFEYEKNDRKSRSSTVSRSIGESIHFRTFRSLSFNFSGKYGKREYTDTDEDETFYTLGADIVWTPEWWLSLNLVCLKNDISGDRLDMGYSEISPKIQLTYGVWKASMSYRLTDQKDRDMDNGLWRQEVYFLVNRELW